MYAMTFKRLCLLYYISYFKMGKGRYPFRRTVEFLSSGKVVLKPNIKTVLLSYSHRENSKGIR